MRFLPLLLLAACATSTSTSTGTPTTAPPKTTIPSPAPAPTSTLANAPALPPPTSPPVHIKGARVLTAAGPIFDVGHVTVAGGRIVDVGPGDGVAPAGAVVVDAKGKTVTPGLIDTHSHMGVYPTPSSNGNDDGNEVGAPKTPEVWSEHGFWPQDASLPRALMKGITTIQVLPGSANLIGGRATTFKLGRVGQTSTTSARAMRFPGAPQGLKMACGQNPKRVYGERGGRPSTRMGNIAAQRAAFQEALEYKRRWEKYRRDLAAWQLKQEKKKQQAASPTPAPTPTPDPAKTATNSSPVDGSFEGPDDPPDPPGRDLGLETLADVIDGKILVHNHCYRADEMNLMMDIAREFGFKIRSFHHAVEAYKIADRLAAEGVAVSTWVDWWGFKMESYDGVRANLALVQAAGGRPVVHSDSDVEIRQLNQEAAKGWAAGKQLGLDISENDVIRWNTANPAWALGIDDQTGTLEKGKMADVVVWSGSPFSTYSKPELVYVDGALAYDAKVGPAKTDVLIGNDQPPPSSTKNAKKTPKKVTP